MRTPEIPIFLAQLLKPFSPFSETWPSNLAPLPAAWTVVPGSTTPQQSNIGGFGFYDANGGTNSAYRDAGGVYGTITIPLQNTSNPGILGNSWAILGWCANASRADMNYVIARADTHVLQYNEQVASSVVATVNGTTNLTGISAGLKVIVSKTGGVIVQLDTGSGFANEIVTQQGNNFGVPGHTFFVLQSAAGVPNAIFGALTMGP